MSVKFPDHNNKFFILLFEFLGTAILILAVTMSGGKAEAAGLTLFGIAVAIGPVSGAMVNPAVTLGIYIADGGWITNLLYMIMIWVAQFAGAFAGIGILTLF